MTSIRQIEANRRNSDKSTGPRTEAGKQRSGAVHGLTAETVVLPLEDPEDSKPSKKLCSLVRSETAVDASWFCVCAVGEQSRSKGKTGASSETVRLCAPPPQYSP